MAGITWWTEDRKAELLRLLETGVTYAQAAVAISGRFRRKVSWDSIEKQARIMGFHGTRGRRRKA
jgi:hypothetical protein